MIVVDANENAPPLAWSNEVLHFANETDDAGLCGQRGYLVESWPHITCPDCLALKGGDNDPQS